MTLSPATTRRSLLGGAALAVVGAGLAACAPTSTNSTAATAPNADLASANAEIQNRTAEIEARLPSDKEVDNIVRQISDLAVSSGLTPPTLATSKPIEAGTYWEQPLTVTTAGNFTGYYRFLQKLERMPRITRIPDFNLTRDPKNDGIVAIEFTLSIFFQDDRQ